MNRKRFAVFTEAVFYTFFLSFVIGFAAYSGYSTRLIESVSDQNSARENDDRTETVQLEIEESSFEEFEATAYCDYGITYSGVLVQRGIVAADPKVLPIGSVIEIKAGDYSGIYTVMDTGGVIKGRIIDIYMPDYEEAIQFGRQKVGLRIIRKGWQPDSPAGDEILVNPSMAVAG
jgi:3D (Asp-Asp-Asp) domain-containing protein